MEKTREMSARNRLDLERQLGSQLVMPIKSPRALELGPLPTMAEGREGVDFHRSDCKKPKIQPPNPPQWRPKSKGRRSPKYLHRNTFCRSRHTLKGSLRWTKMKTHTMVEKPSIKKIFHKKNQKLTRSWLLDWRDK